MTEIQALGRQLKDVSAALMTCDENSVAEVLRGARRLVIQYRSVMDLGMWLKRQGTMEAIPIFYLFKKMVNDLLGNFGLDSTVSLPVDSHLLLRCTHNIGKFLDSGLSGDRHYSESMQYLLEAITDYHLLVASTEEDVQ